MSIQKVERQRHQLFSVVTLFKWRSTNFAILLARNAYDYLNALGALVLCGSPPSACIITPTSIKNQG